MTDPVSGTLGVLLEPDMLLRIVLQIGLFAASAFFSGSETALFSLSRLDLRKLRRQRDPRATTLHELLDQPRRLIISILTGNMLINVAATANLTGILVALYGTEKAVWITTFVMVPLLLLLGEATPKTIAVSDPVKVSTRIIARPMSLWVAFVAPISSAVRAFSDRVTTAIVGEAPRRDNIIQVDEFRTLVEEGVVRGELTAVERALIYNLMQAGSDEVVEIMTPRTRGIFIDADQPIGELVKAFLAFKRSRVPVYRGSRDRVIGFLHAEDITRLVIDKVDIDSLTLDDLLRPSVMVPATKKIDEMFDYFQDNNAKVACVLNEFGGIDGIVSKNDVLNYIFSRPPTETSDQHVRFNAEAGTYTVPGEMKLIDFNKLTNSAVSDSRMTTVAGIVLRALDRLPRVGDTVTVDGIVLTVEEMEDNRIARVVASATSGKFLAADDKREAT